MVASQQGPPQWGYMVGLNCSFTATGECGSMSLRRIAAPLSVVSSQVKMYRSQHFDYFLVLDFEATCDNRTFLRPQEIIEFPVLKISAQTLETESTFHHYVKPRAHTQLSSFCTELTGIIQDMVDDQPYIEDILGMFHKWMLENGLLNKKVKSAFVTCGDWDLKTMLPHQCSYFNITPKPYFNKWINIKKEFCNLTGFWPKEMMAMLKQLRIPHEGKHHSGIDDCHNIGNVLKQMIKKGHVFRINGHLA